jgi:hypothetical protein
MPEDHTLAKHVGFGLLCGIGLIITASMVIATGHFAAGCLIIIQTLVMFMLIVNLAKKADSAVEGVRLVVDTVDLGERPKKATSTWETKRDE